MYPKESTYTSVVYNESNWHSYVNSLYGEKNYINPMITILSLSHLYSKTNKTVVYYPRLTYLTNKVWIVPLNSFIQITIKVFIPAFFIVLSLFVIYRIVKDRANNCLSILYINGVRSYHYVTSLLIFYTLFLLIFMTMFFFSFYMNLDTFSSLCPSRNTLLESQVRRSGIFCGVAFIARRFSF